MENRSWVKAGLIVSLGLALSACAQQGHQAMMESEKGMMKTNQEMKNEDTIDERQRRNDGQDGQRRKHEERTDEGPKQRRHVRRP